jgi:hypothetical protein
VVFLITNWRKIMLRNLLLTILFFVVICLETVFAQTTITINCNNTQSIVRYIDANSNYEYQTGSLYQMGRKDGSNGVYNASPEDIWRSQHQFLLSTIPSNATLSQVTLLIYASGYSSSYKFNVTQTSGTKSWGDLWSEIGSASIQESGLNYSSTSKISSSLLSAVNSARSNGNIYLGAFSQSEGSNNTQADLSLSLQITYTIPVTQVNITAQNSFIYGAINVGVNQSATQQTSPYPFTPTVGNTVNLGAIEQSYGGYNRVWNTTVPNNPSAWVKIVNYNRSTISSSINYSFTAATNDNNSTYEAGLRKLCSATFQNTGYQITINGNQYSSSGTVQVVEQNTVTVSTLSSYTNNGIDYTFSCWTNAGSNYSSPITVSSNITYTAKYIGTPNIANQSINFSTTLYSPIIVYWTDNPNTNVTQYLIYRRIGYIGTPTLIGTVGRGVQQLTDYTWTRMPWKVDTLLCYEVKEYYSIDQTYSPDYWAPVYGSSMWKSKNNNSLIGLASGIPTEYKLENYPNPFNPVTVINYQLPQDGFVTLKVFDILGKEVATVVNEYKNAGYYKVNFDASRLTSGVYIYTINTNNFFLSKKMLLMK